MTVSSTGQVTGTYADATPLQGRGSDGAEWKFVTKGVLNARVQANNGQSQITYLPSNGKQYIYRNNALVTIQHPPVGTMVSGTYTCTTQTLTTVQEGVTTNYRRV